VKLLSKSAAPVLWALAALMVLAPLPEGGAWPWALTLIESVSFALLGLWLLRVARGAAVVGARTLLLSLLMPATLFAVLAMAQIAPLPPAALKTISPATYSLYTVSLPGWPHAHEPAHDSRPARGAVSTAAWRILPTQAELARGAAIPFASYDSRKPSARARSRSHGSAASAVMPRTADSWRTLSLAPSMTTGVLLELAAFAALFFTVLGYPFRPQREATTRRLSRMVVCATMLSGLVVATLGIVELFSWNGRILWLFVPYDWGAAQPGIPLRASGPFVNPDHFGNYMAMVLPLAVAGSMFPSKLFRRARALRVLSAVTAFIVTGALLLSLSRGAWAGGAIALAVLFVLSARMARARGEREAPGYLPRHLIAAGFALVALALILIGPAGRQLVDSRLHQTVRSDNALSGRVELGAATLAMARDYPLLGVGLGAWPEAFPRYRRAPWADVMYREAHDDYAQLLAETGVLGFAVVAWFVFVAVTRLVRGLDRVPPLLSPTFAALCGALSAMAFHELFDFSLHTPANAVLFIMMLATALRISAGPEKHNGALRPASIWRAAALAGGLAAALLTVVAFGQDNVPYPENIKPPATLAQARALIAAHPAESGPHLDLIRLAGGRLPQWRRMAELRAAVWLDPTNPYARDAWAGALLEQGMKTQALENVARSVAASPTSSTHFYLSPRFVPWLSSAQRKAVDSGFRRAIARRYPGAVDGLADFYRGLGRFALGAGVYRRAAARAQDPKARERYLLSSGVAYARASQLADAQQMFERAIRGAPARARAYECLVTAVLGPRRQLKAARAVVARGVRAGADGSVLYAALARAAENAGDRELAQGALQAAVTARPSFTALVRLGTFYLGEGKYDHAALIMREATESRPRSARAYFYLGLAEERNYSFSAAARDLAHAARLAPDNATYRAHYASFERKLAQGLKGVQPLDN
jgi:O-antigen ligase/tetratricopeptide (TPR) repeat protein